MTAPRSPSAPAPVGEERVLTVLAETLAPVVSVDLAPRPAAGAGRSRYTEQALLGRGGLGEVVEAFDEDLRRCVALKRPREDRLGPAAVASLVREAQITAQLDHPNIPPVHTLGIDSAGRPFFTMACLHGETLAALLARRREDPALRARLTRGRLLRIFAQVAYAVAYAHDRGVLHRDLKPANIMIGEFGEVRLMDWGIAKLLREPAGAAGEPEAPEATDRAHRRLETTAPTETAAGTFSGTPGYASPEQVEGRPGIDQRSDLYALGALLYEIVSGRPPITGKSVPEMVDDTREGRIPPLTEVAHASAPLAAIVHKALAKDPEDRYTNALDLVSDLEAMQEGRAVTALEECHVSRAKRWYMSRSPRVARLRNVDVDLLSWSSYVFGVATGGLGVLLGVTWHVHYWWIYTLAALLCCVPPMYTLLRPDRPDDPGHALSFGEPPLTTARPAARTVSQSRAATPEESAPTAVAPASDDEGGASRRPAMTYNFDPDRWHADRLALLEAARDRGELAEDAFAEAIARLDGEHEKLVSRLDGTYQLPDPSEI